MCIVKRLLGRNAEEPYIYYDGSVLGIEPAQDGGTAHYHFRESIIVSSSGISLGISFLMTSQIMS